ncbi:hypothetical protein ABZ319_06955 [Nocardia sp. NPDC005978]|uniref:hypothetical protein n=1 Tax=Nocardia sp. NPDC005978 TaxID=3156725 RepID=UPI0033A67C04
MSPRNGHTEHDKLPDSHMTPARADSELEQHSACATTACPRKAQAKAVLADVTARLPPWVRPGSMVVELSQTRGIVLSRIKIATVTATEITLQCGQRYLIATMVPDESPSRIVFTRQNPFLPLCRIRLASTEHPDTR